MNPSLIHKFARAIQKPAERFRHRMYWRWRNWWLWEFPVHPNFYLFIPLCVYHTWIRRKAVVAIYQPGRVGSTAVTSAIRNTGEGLVFHFHSLSPEYHQKVLSGEIERSLEGREYIRAKEQPVARCIRWVLRRGIPLKVIVLLRDPVGQSLSSFFYNFKIFTGHSLEERDWEISTLLRRFWVQNAFSGYEIFEHWFDTELHRFTNLDVLAEPFDRERGWQEYHCGNMKALVMKIELKDREKENILSDFLGLKNLTMRVINSAEEQQYASLFRAFREKFFLKQEQLDAIYNKRYVEHFYTPDEIAGFKKKWMEKKS